jgi:hypothetical protein
MVEDKTRRLKKRTKIDVTKAAAANLTADAVLVPDAEILLIKLVYVMIECGL